MTTLRLNKPCKRGHTSALNKWKQCPECVVINRKMRHLPEDQRRHELGLPPAVRRPTLPGRNLTEVGHDFDPPYWPDDGGTTRVPIYDHNQYPPRLVRRVGWVNCLGTDFDEVPAHRFLSPDVTRMRVCTKCKGMRYQASYQHQARL